MMTLWKPCSLALLLIVPVVAGAGSAPLGAETRAWLELQRNGNASNATPRPMPGEVADKVYERYLNSFAHPIPDSFSREQFVSGGGGNGSGGAGH
jgi:hypothetical protein